MTSQNFLAGGGEMGALTRAFDWSKTPLGPPETWPQSLRSAVSILLPSRAQIVLFWGPDLITLYNDAYRPVFGAKHPGALGAPVREAWSEIWHTGLKDLFESVLRTGEAFWAEDRLFLLERFGYAEETYFDVSYDPVRDESGDVGGIFCIVSETTGRVLGERRLRTLGDLAARNANAWTVGELCAVSVESLAVNAQDVPFALLYLEELEGARPEPCGATPGLRRLEGARAWPWVDKLRMSELCLVELDPSLGALPTGGWDRAPRQAAVIPLSVSGSSERAGALVAGLNPYRPLDQEYRDFLELLARQISSGVAGARAFEEERMRAESLAEIDRAKTVFFSNVSHEFRTPLTLILGPIRDLLSNPERLPVEGREALEVVQRNSRRLLKLVNTLLDFSRIEAGRAQASYTLTDLAVLTADVASSFRSAIEKAGLELVVDCPPLSEPAYVDHDMWEKIVLNLLSNAFKFTFEGRISVSLRGVAGAVELSVSDTGTGIAAEELPRIFERFRRVEGARGRTHEGTGIGLAFVQELVRLHGGSVRAESSAGKGSRFIVTIPAGKAHLPADRIDADSARSVRARIAEAYVEEALGWHPNGDSEPLTGVRPRRAGKTREPRPRIVWADDNADLREYVCRLLRPDYDVEAVTDGEAALAAVRASRPALVLTDVMMPKLDGLGLLRELRADPRTRSIPVILLSARAGEESRIEALGFGADDYLDKPFSARELVSRIEARLEVVRLKEQLDEQRLQLIDKLREADRRKDEFLATLSHELRNPLAPLQNALHVLHVSGAGEASSKRVSEIMERQVNHLVRLVDDLLEVSRISRGAFELRKERLEVAAIIRNAVETSAPVVSEAGHEISVSLPDEPLSVVGDSVRLAQILANVLNNAAKYTKPRGRIVINARKAQASVEISVEDNGIGLTSDAIGRIFEMFSREDSSTARGQVGLGVGLALARRLAEMHGGTIEATSEGPGRGSTFTLRLPSAPVQASDSAPRQDAGFNDIPQKRVLVVDDNVDAAESMGMLLESLGTDVRTARSGPEALEIIADYAPAAVLLDIGMPGMDGYEVARRIRALDSTHRPTLIALTGWGQDDDRRRAREAGFDHHLVKPADLRALQTILASLGD